MYKNYVEINNVFFNLRKCNKYIVENEVWHITWSSCYELGLYDYNLDIFRGMLMNVGFKEALNESDFDCFIFHDVDLLPEDDRNLYTCPELPRHMSVAVDVFKYRYVFFQ